MNDKLENPPAFPCENDSNKEYEWLYKGMTLRDYFAAAALQGLIASPSLKPETILNRNGLAIAAYRHADAMLEARGK